MIAVNDLRQHMIQTPLHAKKYRVMIVDDEQDITTIFKIGLENNQFIVMTFNDPVEALSRFKPGLYDLMILDIRMPGTNRFQLYYKIRHIDDKIKVCFLTGFEEARGEFNSSFPFLEEIKNAIFKANNCTRLGETSFGLSKLIIPIQSRLHGS